MQEDINDSDFTYDIITKDHTDILNDIKFNNDDDFLLTKSIIFNLEKDIAKTVRSNKVAQIPYIGCIRRNPVRIELSKHYAEFKIARTRMTKEDYRIYTGSTCLYIKEQLKDKDKDKHVLLRLRQINKNKYKTLYMALGKASAEMFIFSIYLLSEIPFSQDVQDAFDALNN